MRRLMFLLLVLILSAVHSFEWYGTKEKISNIRPEIAQKDTMWYRYYNSYAYVWGVEAERAVKVNCDDFDLEYPVQLHAIDSYLYDPGFDFKYRVYAKDGITLLWESAAGTAADDFYNIVYPDSDIILTDDFWVSVEPLSGGNPRLVSSDGVSLTHSYTGSAGTWSVFEDSGDYFEWAIDFALSHYENTTEIFPPILREIAGLENFEDRDAELILKVQEQSTVISPMLGQYDIGGGWVDFNLVQSKGTYTFAGIIPGQPHGTTGLVKFYMEDNYGNAQWSDEYEINWSRDLPLLNEGFEDTFPPAGWVQDTAGSGFVKATTMDGALVHSGGAVLCHWDTEVNNADWIWSPVISLPAANFCTVSFWQSSYWTSYYELHRMVVSTDGGSTYDVLYEGFPPEEEPDYSPWEQKNLTLKEYAGQDIQIGFYYQGNYCDQWFIDDVKLFYDYLPPVPVQLKGNDWLFLQGIIGAYLNNDMELELTVTDESGVDSVKAHYQFPYWFEPADADMVYAGENVWTLSIPAELAETAGEIWFDMYDIGGNSATTAPYEIWFKEDHDPPPPPPKLEGTIAFVNTPMYLTLTFYDESPIDSCNGHYSKDGWVTQYDFEMTPSKIHEYTYSGIIPAESEAVLDGEVKFTIRDSAGNILNTDSYMVQWLGGHTEIFEDFESGSGNWTLTGNWGLEEGIYTSATHSLTESPDSVYTADNTSYAQWAELMDWSSYLGADLSFWCKYDIEEDFDYMHFEISDDGGTSWIRLKTWTGEGVGWHEVKFNLDNFVGSYSPVAFRFLFESDGGYEVNGMYIDDITLNLYTSERPAPPYIHHIGPVHYRGPSYEQTYNSSASIWDVSGIDSTRVYYQVNDGPVEETEMIKVEGNTWNFSIPPMPVGSFVKYWIWARDASIYKMESSAGYYYYISGDHLIYDSGIGSYYMTADDNNAYAVRMSTPGSKLIFYMPYFLVRNYSDVSHISENMMIHIWDDAGGMPGDEMIVPFDVTPANNLEYTLVDLRGIDTSYGVRVVGDFWVGFSAPYGTVYSVFEAADEEGTTAYGRSYKGTWNGSDWNWAQETNDNYHFRSVIGIPAGIDDHYGIPQSSKLYQNYPNPFNPVTKIDFDLAEEADVSLAVYDVTGRKVADLAKGKMQAGSHSADFDGSRLTSGVYYYTLRVGKDAQTKKMIMIK